MNSIDFIKKEVTFASTIEKVWAAITEPTQLSQWFGNHAVFELQEGAIGYFEWTNICEGKYAMQIKTIRAPYYFAWYWMYEPDTSFEMEKATLVEWTLKPTVSGKTHLIVLESGFRKTEHRKMNVQGWNAELADLRKFVD